jgi:predicted RNA-binding Zn ribbon-like protein
MVTLEPSGTGVRRLLAQIVADIAHASECGEWHRMKICPADDCLVVFYDRSKNLSKRWCSMESCGNREKTRAYYRRHAH